MKNKEIEELLNDIKEQLTIDEKLGKEIAQDFHKTTLNYEKTKLLLSYIEQLEEEIAEYEFLIDMQNSREYRSKFLKEFQEEHGKNVFPDYDEIYKRYDKLKKQKVDVVEYIKKDWYSKNTTDINKVVIGDWRIDLLRMLGETNNE